jgi:hypothetical protein
VLPPAPPGTGNGESLSSVPMNGSTWCTRSSPGGGGMASGSSPPSIGDSPSGPGAASMPGTSSSPSSSSSPQPVPAATSASVHTIPSAVASRALNQTVFAI